MQHGSTLSESSNFKLKIVKRIIISALISDLYLFIVFISLDFAIKTLKFTFKTVIIELFR